MDTRTTGENQWNMYRYILANDAGAPLISSATVFCIQVLFTVMQLYGSQEWSEKELKVNLFLLLRLIILK